MDDLLPRLQEQTVLDAAPADLTIIELLQQILARANAGVEPTGTVEAESGAAQVVLDVRVGSDRYILTRAYHEPSAFSATLSPREKEIVRLVSKGLPNKVISGVLDISPWTVATHLRRVFAKLGVSSRAEMVALVIQARLLE